MALARLWMSTTRMKPCSQSFLQVILVHDVIVPSDYMVSILIAAGKIQKLNFDAIPNAKNISADFSGLYYDPEGEYTVPYQWGTTGIGGEHGCCGRRFPTFMGFDF